jgi:two-component system sensor histidine kinase DegS
MQTMALPPPQTKEFFEHVLSLEGQSRQELEQSSQSLTEIALLLGKTNSEVERHSARELQLSNRLRDMEHHLENYSREDIRDLYNTAHEAQLRLFMLRSQAEQLQARQEHIKEYQQKTRLLIDLLALQAASQDDPGAAKSRRQPTAMLRDLGDEEMPDAVGIIEAQEDERARISRQIHDGPTQALTNLILRAEICERLIDRDIDEARSELGDLRAMINASLQETRRIMFDLRPMILDEIGLVPTLRRYMSELGRLKDLQFSISGPEEDANLTGPLQTALFRMVQSVLSAILAEGSADQIDISIGRTDSTTRLKVEASALQTDREVINERLQETHFQHRLQLLKAKMTPENRSNRGISIDIVIPMFEAA